MDGIHGCLKLESAQDVNLPIGIENGKVRKIPLTLGKEALVDEEDYEWLNKYRWHAAKHRYTFYAVRAIWNKGRQVNIKMHREILGLKYLDGKLGDHRDRNGLNNRRRNLRVATTSLNGYNAKIKTSNSSGYRGVNIMKTHGYQYWRARISVCRKRVCCGIYDNPISAAIAYDNAALEYYGADANLNFPEGRIL